MAVAWRQTASHDSRKGSWLMVKEPDAVVYNAQDDRIRTEKTAILDAQEDLNVIKFELPKWRNRVSIYLDPISRTGYIASVKISQIGWTKNLQRHMGRNYTTLYLT